MNVGFIGLGQMGRPMVERLKGAGHSLKVYNRTRSSSGSTGESGIGSRCRDRHHHARRRCRGARGVARLRARPAPAQGRDPPQHGDRQHGHLARAGSDPRKSSYVAAPVFGRPPLAAQGSSTSSPPARGGARAAASRCSRSSENRPSWWATSPPRPTRSRSLATSSSPRVIESLGEAFALVRKCGIDISSLAQALGPSRLGQRGPRRPTDIDVLEVIIDLSGRPPLLPGMRVDVFLKADAAAAQPAAAARQLEPKIKAN